MLPLKAILQLAHARSFWTQRLVPAKNTLSKFQAPRTLHRGLEFNQLDLSSTSFLSRLQATGKDCTLSRDKKLKSFKSFKSLSLGLSTIERWYYRALNAKDDPVGVPQRKLRCDHSQHPALSSKLREVLAARYRQHPNWSYHSTLIALLAAALILDVLVSSRSIVRRLLVMKWLVWIGRLSEECYKLRM